MDAMTVKQESGSAIANLDVKHSALASNQPIRLMNAGLDERGSEIVAHGWLDLDAMRALRVDDYQREVLSGHSGRKVTVLQRAVADGARLPDIMIGMRGEKYEAKGHSMVLLDRCYIIDGLQRIAALLHYADAHPEESKDLRIGAEVRFDTTKEIEKELFQVLNTSRVPVSPNVILRNLRDKHQSILTLYGLCHSDSKFALFQRVSWQQRMTRTDLLTALMLAKTAMSLHASTGLSIRTERAPQAGVQLDKAAKAFGLNTFRRNVAEFFEVVDQSFGIRAISYVESCPQLKTNFLNALAKVFALHENFWDDKGNLVVDHIVKRKLATFPIEDPEVRRLASAGNMALPILFNMLTEHLDKGKRLHRLKKRDV